MHHFREFGPGFSLSELDEFRVDAMTILPFPISTSCTGRTMPALTAPELRERALANYYAAERRKGVDSLTANRRMHEFAKNLDAMNAAFEADLDVIRDVLERT